jgi:hypothetical protein
MISQEAELPASTVIIPFLGDCGHIGNLIQILQELESKLEYKVVFDERNNEVSRKNLKILERHIPQAQLIRGYFGSAGAARNAALPKVTTKWFSFCDSDDHLYVSSYLKILEDVKHQEIEICVSSFQTISRDGRVIHKIIDLKKNQKELLFEMGKNPGIWRYIFLSSKFSQIRFPELSMGEDQAYLSSIFQTYRSIHFSNRETYRYSIASQDSLTSNKTYISDLEESIRICKSNFLEGEFLGFQAVMVIRQSLTLVKFGSIPKKIFAVRELIQFMIKMDKISFPRKAYFFFKAIV